MAKLFEFSVEITNQSQMMTIFNVIIEDLSKEKIIEFFDCSPSYTTQNFCINSSTYFMKCMNALYPERIDLIEKHQISTIKPSFINIIKSCPSKYSTEEIKCVIDVLQKYKQFDDDNFIDEILRIPDLHVRNLLIDYCLDKGYFRNVSKSLAYLVYYNQDIVKYDYSRFLDAGADPTISYYTPSYSICKNMNAIGMAFEFKDAAAIRLYVSRGYDISEYIKKIPMEKRHRYGFISKPIVRMIADTQISLLPDTLKATATSIGLDGLVTTQLDVIVTKDDHYVFVDSVTKTVFGNNVPVSIFE